MSIWSSLKAALRFPPWGGYGGFQPWVDRPVWNPTSSYDYAAAAGDLRYNPVVAACIAWMQRTFPEPDVVVLRKEPDTGEENPVHDHPLLKFLNAPNPFETGDMLWLDVLPDFMAGGNAFLVKERNGSGRPVELWHVPRERIRPVWKPSGFEYIGSYEIVINGEPQPRRVEDVVHLRFGKDPQNERMGWSPFRAGLREAASLNEGGNYRGDLLRNGACPPWMFSAKEKTATLTKDQRDDLKKLWRESTGPGQRGLPIFNNIPLDAFKLGFSPEEVEIMASLGFDADILCSLAGLNSMVLALPSGANQRTYANYAEAREAAYESNLIPTQSLFAGILTRQLLPDFGDPLTERVAWDYSRVRALTEDEGKKFDRYANAWKSGMITRAVALAGIGEVANGGDDLADGTLGPDDVYMLPQGVTLVAADKMPEEMEEEKQAAAEAVRPALPESSGDAQATSRPPQNDRRELAERNGNE